MKHKTILVDLLKVFRDLQIITACNHFLLLILAISVRFNVLFALAYNTLLQELFLSSERHFNYERTALKFNLCKTASKFYKQKTVECPLFSFFTINGFTSNNYFIFVSLLLLQQAFFFFHETATSSAAMAEMLCISYNFYRYWSCQIIDNRLEIRWNRYYPTLKLKFRRFSSSHELFFC